MVLVSSHANTRFSHSRSSCSTLDTSLLYVSFSFLWSLLAEEDASSHVRRRPTYLTQTHVLISYLIADHFITYLPPKMYSSFLFAMGHNISNHIISISFTYTRLTSHGWWRVYAKIKSSATARITPSSHLHASVMWILFQEHLQQHFFPLFSSVNYYCSVSSDIHVLDTLVVVVEIEGKRMVLMLFRQEKLLLLLERKGGGQNSLARYNQNTTTLLLVPCRGTLQSMGKILEMFSPTFTLIVCICWDPHNRVETMLNVRENMHNTAHS